MRLVSSLLMVGMVSLVFAGAAHAETITWSDKNVDFTLDVTDLGSTVNATLTVESTANEGDYLKYVGFKIWSGNPPSSSGTLDSASATGYSFLDGFRVGGGSGILQGAGAGFVGADNSGNGPVMNNGSTYTFDFSWTGVGNDSLNSEWSIKAWTATGRGTRAASGPLGDSRRATRCPSRPRCSSWGWVSAA